VTVTRNVPVYEPDVCRVPTFRVAPTVSGEAKRSPGKRLVVNVFTAIVLAGIVVCVSIAFGPAVTVTTALFVHVYGPVLIEKLAAVAPAPINTTPPVATLTPAVSTITVPAKGAAKEPNCKFCIAVITRLASQFVGLGGQAGGQTGPPPGGVAGAAMACFVYAVVANPNRR
jgi:hypothetical protein